MNLTEQEKAIVEVVRINKIAPRLEVTRKFKLGRVAVTYNRRSSKNLWGRFGAGWNWKLGVSIGSTTVIVDLLVASLRFTVIKKGDA